MFLSQGMSSSSPSGVGKASGDTVGEAEGVEDAAPSANTAIGVELLDTAKVVDETVEEVMVVELLPFLGGPLQSYSSVPFEPPTPPSAPVPFTVPSGYTADGDAVGDGETSAPATPGVEPAPPLPPVPVVFVPAAPASNEPLIPSVEFAVPPVLVKLDCVAPAMLKGVMADGVMPPSPEPALMLPTSVLSVGQVALEPGGSGRADASASAVQSLMDPIVFKDGASIGKASMCEAQYGLKVLEPSGCAGSPPSYPLSR